MPLCRTARPAVLLASGGADERAVLGLANCEILNVSKDSTTTTWRPVEALRHTVSEHASATLNDSVYITGGWRDGSSNYQYQHGRWLQKQDMYNKVGVIPC